MATAALQSEAERHTLMGDLSFATVPALWQDVQALLQAPAEFKSATVDLAQVSRSDSSGVALLVAWLSQAQQLGQAVQFINAPTQMRALVQVAGLTELLGWEPN